jgi:hypothetical protein
MKGVYQHCNKFTGASFKRRIRARRALSVVDTIATKCCGEVATENAVVTGAPEDETAPEMIKAGKEAWWDWQDREDSFAEDLVKSIYLAMRTEARKRR